MNRFRIVAAGTALVLTGGIAAAVVAPAAPAPTAPAQSAAEGLCLDLSPLNLPSVCIGPLLGAA